MCVIKANEMIKFGQSMVSNYLIGVKFDPVLHLYVFFISTAKVADWLDALVTKYKFN